MDISVREAVVFLLREYMEATGAKYARCAGGIGDLRKDEDVLRGVLQAEVDGLEGKLAKAKVYLEVLEREKG